MAERVVIDASVAIAYLRDEERTTEVKEAVRAWARSGDELFVPSLLWLEVLNGLRRRHGWASAAIVEGLLALDGLEARTVEADRPLQLLAIDRMEALGLTAYDALYLALAISLDARLATLDERMARAAGSRAVQIAGAGLRRLAEPSVPYPEAGREPLWAHSALVGAHISELRRQALSGRGT